MDDDDDFLDEIETGQHDEPPAFDVPDPEFSAAERELLLAIQADPHDFGQRVVYADWLEQRGDTLRAELARLLSVDPRPGTVAGVRLARLGRGAPADWLAILGRGPIDGCDRSCTQQWENLATTEDPRARRCAACQSEVLFCPTIEAAGTLGGRRVRVAFSQTLDRRDACHFYRLGAPPPPTPSPPIPV